MSETREIFNVETELKQLFLTTIKKVTGIILVIKESEDIHKRLLDLEKEEKKLTEQLNSLNMSFELVTKSNAKKSIKEIITIKEKELEKNSNEINELKAQSQKNSDELDGYEKYIDYIYNLTDDCDECEIDIKALTLNEFIAFLLICTNYGEYSFPRYYDKDYPESFHELIGVIRENNWNSFIKWIKDSDI